MASIKNISIKKKLILIQVATGTIAVLICCIIFVYNDIITFKKSSVSNNYSIAEIVGENSIAPLEFNDMAAANEILLNFKNNTTILNATLLDKEGKEFAKYDKKGEENYSFPLPSSGTSVPMDSFFEQKFIVTYQIFQDKELIGTVMLRAEITDFNTIVYNYIKTALIVLIVSVLLAFLISNLFQRIITKRLLSLVAKTKEVTETGNYSIRSSVIGTDEIEVLSEGFNTMLDQIEKAEKTLKEINMGLEKRVKERTLELETVNKSLLVKSEELSASNQELEQFAYVASHDLQEPLRSISNFVGLLEKKLGETNKDTELYFKFILTATTKMQNLIKDLLDFSRVGRNMSVAVVDCNKILKEILADLDLSIQESNAKITSDLLPVLSGNETELKRLFLNLISNAIKFRPKDRTPEIAITVEAKDTEYLFAIKDNGIGIKEQFIPKLFVIFQRLNRVEEYPGTGIGLATCKKIVTLHNGKIWIESKWGEGTTFYFTLPKENKNN